MNRKSLVELFYDLEAIEQSRRSLGEYDSNSAVIITALTALKELTAHLIEEKSRIDRAARKAAKGGKNAK